MDNILYSQGMIEFYNMFREDMDSAEECAEQLKLAVPSVADEMHLGRLDMSLIAPSNTYDVSGINGGETVYIYDDGYDEEYIEYKYTTGEKGLVTVSIYPRRGYKWNEREKEAISVFALNLYMLGGRARLINLVRKSQIKDNATGLDNVNGFMKYASEISYKVGLEKYHGIRFNIKYYGAMIQSISIIKSNEVMRYYGNLIKDFVKEDGRVARLGGDNFVALIKDEKVEEFIAFLSDIPIRIDEMRELKFCARMGVYNIQPKDSIGAVMNYIDIALSKVKQHGTDVVRYEENMIKNT